MIPIMVTKTIPINVYTSAGLLASAKVAVDSITRFKYIEASIAFVINSQMSRCYSCDSKCHDNG